MANPPITIGPFTNVPAPGSPIRSDWPQSISTFVTALPRGLRVRRTKAANESGFGAEAVIADLGFTVPLAGRWSDVHFALAAVQTIAPSSGTYIIVRLRRDNVAGALIGAQIFDWPVGAQGFQAATTNLAGSFRGLGLAVGQNLVLTFFCPGATFRIDAGSMLILDDKGA